MNNFNLKIKSGSGKFSKLDKLYRDFVINSTNNLEDSHIDRWEVYNVIMDELIKIGEYSHFEESKYRITGGENPNLVMLDMLDKFFTHNHLFFTLKSIIEEFIDEDNINRFI